MLRSWFLAVACVATLPCVVSAQADVDGFVAHEFRAAASLMLPYRLFTPARIDGTQRYPLVIYLHGSGGAGTDNLKQIAVGNRFGTDVWTDPALQRRQPVFVVAPQAAENEQLGSVTRGLSPYAEATVALVQRLVAELPNDTYRIVITGQSRGGFGVWDLAGKRPDLFAAAIPLCGGGDPAGAADMRRFPIWAFHGALDETVPVAATREMVAALKAVGADVRYTEYPDLGHAIWQHVPGHERHPVGAPAAVRNCRWHTPLAELTRRTVRPTRATGAA